MSLKQNIKAFFCSILSVLLGVVIVFNLSFNAFHIHSEEHHHSSEQTCSDAEESDACHRFLIHNEKSAGCDGSHQHLTNKADDCFACNFFKNQQQSIETDPEVCFLSQSKDRLYSNKESGSGSTDIIYAFLRGPPAIS